MNNNLISNEEYYSNMKCPICRSLLKSNEDYIKYCKSCYYTTCHLIILNENINKTSFKKDSEHFHFNIMNILFYNIDIHFNKNTCEINKCKKDINAGFNIIGQIKFDKIPNWDFYNESKIIEKLDKIFILQ